MVVTILLCFKAPFLFSIFLCWDQYGNASWRDLYFCVKYQLGWDYQLNQWLIHHPFPYILLELVKCDRLKKCSHHHCQVSQQNYEFIKVSKWVGIRCYHYVFWKAVLEKGYSLRISVNVSTAVVYWFCWLYSMFQTFD